MAGKKIFKETAVTPSKILAGDSTEFVIKMVLDADYPSCATRLVVECQSLMGQSHTTRGGNEVAGFVDAYVSNPHVEYGIRSWAPFHRFFEGRETPRLNEGIRMVVLDLSAGLKENDVLEVHWGDTFGGNRPGTRATTVVPQTPFYSWIKIRFFDHQGKGMPDYGRELPGCPRPVPDVEETLRFQVLPRDAREWRLIRKCDKAILIPQDVFWNVAEVPDLDSVIECSDSPVKNSHGVFEFADRDVQILSKKLPVKSTALMHDVFEGHNLFWGDLHVHSRFSSDAGAQQTTDMTPAELMEAARDRAGLDFFAVADHHMPGKSPLFSTLTEDEWNATLDAVRRLHRDGDFVVFPAFEFSDMQRGDTVVVFKDYMPSYNEIVGSDINDLRFIWERFKKTDLITIPHFHNCGGKSPEWLIPRDARQEPVLEVFSCHGSYENIEVVEHARPVTRIITPDRYGSYFIKAGYKYGLVANSDTHKGNVGRHGVTAVFAKSLDRESIFQAYRSRHVYGTTNARIRLVFTGQGNLMGSVIPNTKRKYLHVDVTGENPLKKIDLIRNGCFYRRLIPDRLSFQHDVVVEDEEPCSFYVRVTQIDNQIAWSSPVWYE